VTKYTLKKTIQKADIPEAIVVKYLVWVEGDKAAGYVEVRGVGLSGNIKKFDLVSIEKD
jgi:hypothetical protein